MRRFVAVVSLLFFALILWFFVVAETVYSCVENASWHKSFGKIVLRAHRTRTSCMFRCSFFISRLVAVNFPRINASKVNLHWKLVWFDVGLVHLANNAMWTYRVKAFLWQMSISIMCTHKKMTRQRQKMIIFLHRYYAFIVFFLRFFMAKKELLENEILMQCFDSLLDYWIWKKQSISNF